MLTFRKLDYRPWPVTVAVHVCDEATGQVAEVEHRFIGHFIPFAEADLLALRLSIFGDEAEAGNKQRLADMPVADYERLEARFLGGLLRGWSQVADEHGAAVPYSAETLRELCTGHDGATFRRGFNRAVSEIRFGVAPAKNVETSPSPGPVPASGEGERVS